ncbi:hypothetical protein SDC9_38191 [bioreactor metagenome]|uniref:Uncharacterized protein n=1 Tax=bioreactor metagenome TaxID=1076179 RepID=A0A644VL07_9ZZZZ
MRLEQRVIGARRDRRQRQGIKRAARFVAQQQDVDGIALGRHHHMACDDGDRIARAVDFGARGDALTARAVLRLEQQSERRGPALELIDIACDAVRRHVDRIALVRPRGHPDQVRVEDVDGLGRQGLG